MSKIKNGGLDQYGTGPFEQQQFATAGVERVNCHYGSWPACDVTRLLLLPWLRAYSFYSLVSDVNVHLTVDNKLVLTRSALALLVNA